MTKDIYFCRQKKKNIYILLNFEGITLEALGTSTKLEYKKCIEARCSLFILGSRLGRDFRRRRNRQPVYRSLRITLQGDANTNEFLSCQPRRSRFTIRLRSACNCVH